MKKNVNQASAIDSDYARGYLAAKGVQYDGPSPVEYLSGYLFQRNDAARNAKCDPRKGWVRGPGGKCVRKSKKDLMVAGALAGVGSGLLAASAIGGQVLARQMSNERRAKKEQMNQPQSLTQRQLPKSISV